MRKLFGGLGNLLFLVKPYWKYGKLFLIGNIAVSALINPALNLIQVRLIQLVIDAIIAGATMRETIMVAAALVATTLGLTVLSWGFWLLYDRWKGVEIQNKINRSIYERAIATDYQYFDNPEFYNDFTFAVGELAAKSESSFKLLMEMIGAISSIIAMTAFLSTLGPWVILISVVGQAICLFAQRIIQKLGIKITTESLPFDRKLNYVHRVSYQREYAADMKSSSLPQKVLSIFDKNGEWKVGLRKKYRAKHSLANNLQFVTWDLCQFTVLAYLIYCVFTQGIGIGMVVGMFAAADRLNMLLNRFVSFSGRAMESSLYADKIKAFFNYESTIEPQAIGREPPDGAFTVDLQDMSFAYPKSSFALKGINLRINPNEKIAIVGENGAGKITLAKLLLRLYDVDGGEILYNGLPVCEYDVHQLRRKIGVAFQDPQIFALTVRENMELYNSADDETLREVLQKVGLNIELDGEVTREFDESGTMFSGGQAQKLGLTRLLHGEFGLLLLDEPSSALDPLAEYELTKLIFEQSKTTTIMVAHRLSTIRDADRIYLMDGGQITEQGTHDELMALGGKYAEMFTKQAENYVR